MKIALLRHGQSVSTESAAEELCPSDSCNPLTARGREQVEAIAAQVGSLLSAPRVFSSDMRRALESAEIIARRLDVPMTAWPELREILDVDGSVTGGSLRSSYERFWHDFYCGNADDEWVKTARHRADELVARLTVEYRDDSDIIAVAHGGIIEVLMSRLLGDCPRPGYTIEFALRPASFHLLEMVLGGDKIAHLRLHHANHGID